MNTDFLPFKEKKTEEIEKLNNKDLLAYYDRVVAESQRGSAANQEEFLERHTEAVRNIVISRMRRLFENEKFATILGNFNTSDFLLLPEEYLGNNAFDLKKWLMSRGGSSSPQQIIRDAFPKIDVLGERKIEDITKEEFKRLLDGLCHVILASLKALESGLEIVRKAPEA